MTVADLTRRLLDDTALIDGTPPAAALTAHQALLSGSQQLINALVVPEQELGAVSRLIGGDPSLAVQMVAASGAGSLSALTRRSLPGLTITAVRVALRDPEDLATNAARVVAAAAELPESITVLVELPHAPGWVAAAETVEAAGLTAAVGISATAGSPAQLVEQLSVLVELDLPFVITAVPTSPSAVLVCVEALIDGAEAAEATALLTITDPDRLQAALQQQDQTSAARIRRRVRSIGCSDVEAASRALSS